MKEQKKISVVINTYNAEPFLAQVLEAVKDFDETVVCDMESTDNTVEIAKSHGCRVVTFPKGEHRIVEPARDFAIHQASNDWVLVIDADEIVTPQLRERLYREIEQPDCPDGFFISRHNILMGKFTVRKGRDYILRFFRQSVTSWPPTIHSIPEVKGHVATLPVDFELLHLADETMREWVDKMNAYTDNEIEKKSHRHYGVWSLFWRPFWRFFRSYLLRGGFREGRRGLLQATQWAVYQQILVAKMMEKKLREEP